MSILSIDLKAHRFHVYINLNNHRTPDPRQIDHLYALVDRLEVVHIT
jgi:hypothetical protein